MDRVIFSAEVAEERGGALLPWSRMAKQPAKEREFAPRRFLSVPPPPRSLRSSAISAIKNEPVPAFDGMEAGAP